MCAQHLFISAVVTVVTMLALVALVALVALISSSLVLVCMRDLLLLLFFVEHSVNGYSDQSILAYFERVCNILPIRQHWKGEYRDTLPPLSLIHI